MTAQIRVSTGDPTVADRPLGGGVGAAREAGPTGVGLWELCLPSMLLFT